MIKFILSRIKRSLISLLFSLRWAQKNKHNYTRIGTVFHIEHVHVGNFTYGTLNIVDVGTASSLRIGSLCSIADGVWFLLNAEHDTQYFTTYPVKYNILRLGEEAQSKGDIIVEDDVWIGQNAIILSGITIHRGAVIAAGSVVTHDVPAYSVVAGNPAKIIKYRFSAPVINVLMTINYNQLNSDCLKKIWRRFPKHLSETTLSEFCDCFELAKGEE